MPADRPASIGPYEVTGELGAGITGKVYKAVRAGSPAPVAVKVLDPRAAADPAHADLFRREAEAMVRLVHPNIARVLDVGAAGSVRYLAKEYVDGTSLADRLRAGRLTPTETLYVIEEIARGLEFVHRHGIVHGDLTPRNVIVSPDLSTVKLTDVGLTHPVLPEAEGITGTVVGPGAMRYSAPEQAQRGAKPDQRSDVYALGVIFYEALTGQPPAGRVGLASEINKDVPVSLDPILLKCLASDPADRYASVSALLVDLAPLEKVTHHKLARELKQFAPTRFLAGTAAAPPPRTSMTRVVIGVAAVVVILVAIALSVRWYGRFAPEPSAPAPTATAETPPGNPPATPAVPVPAEPQVQAPAQETAPAQAPVQQAASTPPEPAAPPPPGVPAGTDAQGSMNGEAAAALTALRAEAGAMAPADAVRRQRDWLARYGGTPSAAAAMLLLADTQARAGQVQDAMLTCRDIETRFRGEPRAADALLRHARWLQQVKARPEETLARLTEIARSYPASDAFLPAMTLKAAIEDKLKLQEVDPQTGASVPASLATRRLVASRSTDDAAVMSALRQVADTYDDLKRYDQAASTYTELGTRYPLSTPDPWFAAAELYEKRLNDKTAARAAYLKVPPGSSRYKDAQSRAQKLR